MTEPSLGYFSSDLTREQLIAEVAERYDAARASALIAQEVKHKAQEAKHKEDKAFLEKIYNINRESVAAVKKLDAEYDAGKSDNKRRALGTLSSAIITKRLCYS